MAGRIRDKDAIRELLNALAEDNDRVLDHSLTFALIEIADKEQTALGLLEKNPRVVRATLIALDQMNGGGLKVDAVAAELSSPDAALRETATWIAVQHPGWGADLAGFFRDRLKAKDLSANERAALIDEVSHFAATPAIQEWIAQQVRDGRGRLRLAGHHRRETETAAGLVVR